MTSQPAPAPDPTLAIAERQLAILGELAQIAMAAARAFGSSAVAAAKAEEAVLAEEYFVPEVGRARACGARDAAESFQKASRAVRLTLKLEMAVAEIVRDIRAGVVTHSAPRTLQTWSGPAPMIAGVLQAGVHPAGRHSDRDARDRDRQRADSEPVVEFDRPEILSGILSGAPFRAAVDALCADIGARADWDSWTIIPPDPLEADKAAPFMQPPSAPKAGRSRGGSPVDRELALSP